jgi:serine/threonine-protein kinase
MSAQPACLGGLPCPPKAGPTWYDAAVRTPFDPDSRPGPALPRTAGSYRLDEEIARGGFGVVYRATHASNGLHFAVKVLHAELSGNASSALRFEREAAVVLSLLHPNIVKTHEWGRLDDGRPYLVMELLAGESLEARLKRMGTLPVEEALSILEPLAGALAAVHGRGIVHRDIKPPNVFLADGRAEGRVVLLDFGIAKLVAAEGPALTSSRATVGTIPFMAPEQIRGEPLDLRADVYALAALAYAMLTGKAPFGAQVTAVLRQIHLHARPPRPSERAPVDPALDEPLLAALARDPRDRPASAPAFVEALRASVQPGSPAHGALPAGALERPALAVFAEVRAGPAALAEGDALLLDALETSLPIVWAELSPAGLVALGETATTLLAVSTSPPDAAFSAQVVAACVRAYRRIMDGPARGRPLEVGIAVHVGALHVNEAGAILSSGLADTKSWSPAGLCGVAASRAALADEPGDREPVALATGFYRVLR